MNLLMQSPSVLARVHSPEIRLELPPQYGVADPHVARHRGLWQRSTGSDREIVVREYHDVTVHPRGLVLDRRGEPLAETLQGHSESAVAEARAAVVTETLDDRHILAARPGLSCYGHVIGEIIAPLSLTTGFDSSPLIASVRGPLSDVYASVIDRLGYDNWSSFNQPVRVETLITVDGFAVTDEYLSPLIRAFAEDVSSYAVPTRNVFLPRRASWGRAVVNEAEVDAMLGDFDTLHPEDLPFDEQVSAFGNVDTIVATMGSALTNMLFMPPGGKVVTLAPDVMSDSFFWRLATILGHEYVDLRCVTVESAKSRETGRPLDRDIVVDTGALADLLSN